MSRIQPSQAVDVLRNFGMKEQSSLSGFVADTGVKDIQTLTFGAFALFAQGDFFIVENAAGLKFAVWFDLDANGTEPNGALYTAADTKIEVNIATGNTATQVATAVAAAITAGLAAADVTVTNPSAGVVRVAQDLMGVTVAAASYLEDESTVSAGITPAVVTAGVDSNWLDKYILFSKTGTDYYAWANVNSEGTDPTVASRTGVEVALSASDSAATILSAFIAAIEAVAGIHCVAHDSGLQIITDASGNVSNATAGNSPATLSSIEQGTSSTNGQVSPGDSPADLTNAPSIIS